MLVLSDLAWNSWKGWCMALRPLKHGGVGSVRSHWSWPRGTVALHIAQGSGGTRGTGFSYSHLWTRSWKVCSILWHKCKIKIHLEITVKKYINQKYNFHFFRFCSSSHPQWLARIICHLANFLQKLLPGIQHSKFGGFVVFSSPALNFSLLLKGINIGHNPARIRK